MDAVFLFKPVGRNGAAGARSFHEKIQTIAPHVVHTFTCNAEQEATCNTDNGAIPACWYPKSSWAPLPFDGRADAAKRGSVDVPQARHMFDIAPEGSIGDHFADCRRMIDKTLPIWHG